MLRAIKIIIGIIVIAVVLIVSLFVFVLTRSLVNEPVVDPPCSELSWMRDLPQKRCVEYWKQRDLEESR
jgi:hypothetical protein